MNIVSTDDLINEFNAFGISLSKERHDQLLERFRTYSILYNRDAESLVESWLAFCARRRYDIFPSDTTLEVFERDEHETLKIKSEQDNATQANGDKNSRAKPFRLKIALDEDILGDYTAGSTFAKQRNNKKESVSEDVSSPVTIENVKIKEEPKEDETEALDPPRSENHEPEAVEESKNQEQPPDLIADIKKEPCEIEEDSMVEVKIEPQDESMNVDTVEAKKEMPIYSENLDSKNFQELIISSSQLSDLIPCAFGQPYIEPDASTQTSSKEKFIWKQLLDQESLQKDTILYPRWVDCREVISSAIDDIARDLDIEWASLFVDYGEDRYYIGRVVNDGTQPKLTFDNLTFVSSPHPNCKRVRLNIEALEKISLFSGQILGLKGRKIEKNLHVTDWVDYKRYMLPFSANPVSLAGRELNMYVAVGPFFMDPFSEKMEFNSLLEIVKEAQPDYLVLVGPFFDSNSEKIIASNNCPNEMFDSFVAELNDGLFETKTHVFLVPSTNEAHHRNIFPTPSFQYPADPTPQVKYEKLSKVSLLPNPSVIDINGVVFGFTSVDIILELSRAEISHGMSDRITRLCEHVVTQRSFYPIYPHSSSLTIDYTRLDLIRFPDVTPHVLILPSELRHFIKDIHGCVCVNPERLIKHQKRGFYSRIQIKPPSQQFKLEPGQSLKNYISAQIVKI